MSQWPYSILHLREGHIHESQSLKEAREWLVEYNAALASICFTVLLIFVDDVFDVPWRVKLVLPSIAALPLLMAYAGHTTYYTKAAKPLVPYVGLEDWDLGVAMGARAGELHTAWMQRGDAGLDWNSELGIGEEDSDGKGLYNMGWSSLNAGWAASVLAAPGLMALAAGWAERVRARARVWRQGSMAGHGTG
ncbi:hypothetical protein M0R45_035106 [Rubus argutus]|uniref:Uncharacterized protein n=1 Tax=Rubus argutus TaxID=59490 RepID=A0AAW1VXH4_RUBAR